MDKRSVTFRSPTSRKSAEEEKSHMLGAIYIGLSGMDAYSKGLQTISNNVANLNTEGYKQNSLSFNDLFSVGGSGLTFGDAQQRGNGVQIGSPLIDFSQGEL